MQSSVRWPMKEFEKKMEISGEDRRRMEDRRKIEDRRRMPEGRRVTVVDRRQLSTGTMAYQV